MGLSLPETIRVMSPDFKEFIKELVFEVNRVSEAYMDLQRVRASEESDEPGGSSGAVSFFEILEGDGPLTPTSLAEDLVVQQYNGTIFDVVLENGAYTRSNVVESASGFDLGITENPPDIKPPLANIVQSDQLDTGSIVMCQRLGEGAAIFSSVKPRLSVECEE